MLHCTTPTLFNRFKGIWLLFSDLMHNSTSHLSSSPTQVLTDPFADFPRNSELVNFAESNPRLEIMDRTNEDPSSCQKCRRLSSSFNRSSLTFSASEMNNYVAENNDRPDNIYVVRTNSYRNDSVSVNGSAYGGSLREDAPFILDDELRVDFSNSSSHCHVSEPQISASAVTARRQLIISSILCLIFMIAEVIGGYFANSLAIMTDAAHMLSDFASFMISLFAVYMGQKKPTRKMSFGYYRAEVLGAVTSVLIIWLISGVIVYMAIQRLIKDDFHIDADIMLIVSGSGVAMNILMGIVLHGMCHCHTHSHGFGGHGHSHEADGHGHSHGFGGHGHSHGSEVHGHSHDSSANGHSHPQNINVRAAFIHVIGDLIQSIGVLIAAYIIKYKPEYKLADPICTFIFSAVVLFTTIAIMKDALYVLMEGFPKGIDYYSVITDLTRVEGVKAVHSLHVWSLTMDKNALSVHLAIEPGQDSQVILKEALGLVRSKYDIFHPTIQVEAYEPNMTSCMTCQGPQK